MPQSRRMGLRKSHQSAPVGSEVTMTAELYGVQLLIGALFAWTCQFWACHEKGIMQYVCDLLCWAVYILYVLLLLAVCIRYYYPHFVDGKK